MCCCDASRHLCGGDNIFSDAGASILIKWSKTLQNRVSTTTTVIPSSGDSAFCPIRALRSMLAARQVSSDQPLFLIPSPSQWLVLTDSRARKHLKQVSQILYLPKAVTFHDFRHGGASWAFSRADSGAGHLVLLMCLDVYLLSPCFSSGGFCLSVIPFCLVYHYWVFGAFLPFQNPCW